MNNSSLNNLTWRINNLLIISIAILLSLGAIAVDSASMLPYLRFGRGEFSFFFKHLIAVLIGIFVGGAILFQRDKFYRRGEFILLLNILTLSLLGLVFHFPARNGAHRWIELFGFTFQPSELAKFSLILTLAYFLGREGRTQKDEKMAIGYSLLIMVFVIVEPDFGTAFFLAVITTVMLFISGVDMKKIARVGLIAGAIVFIFILLPTGKHFRKRASDYLHDPRAIHQRNQALIALGSGGITGRSPGESLQKFLYLPEAHSDFIFSILGEELGVWATVLVVLSFMGIGFSGLRIARSARDRKSALIAYGISSAIVIQAFLNISVNVGILPPKGIPLPFMSYGGSSMVMSLVMVGVLMHIWVWRRDET